MEKVLTRKNGAVIIKETEFKDKHYIDIRSYYKDKETDELKPTQKGVSLSYREFIQLFRFIKECRTDEDFMTNFEAYKHEGTD